MENKTTVAIIFSTLLCVLAHSTALRRTESLFDTILKRNIVDRSEFKASDQRFRDANTLVHSQNGVKESDKIWRLPGQPMVSFNQYGGYVTVDQKAGRALYYYFAEADQRSANTLPLLLWLNGGPGCSSLGYGAMLELGPFRVHSDGKTLYTNSFAWNKVANVLFLESPAGVGFSYSNTTNDTVNSDDASTAVDNYAFLLNWLERFPEYKNRDLYICGESYSGHYVPQLAQTVLQYNEMAKKIIINLKGILIGNPVINDETDDIGTIKYLGSHALISDDITNEILKYCNFSPSAHDSDNCKNAIKEARKELGFIDYFNPYNIYASLCSNHNLTLKPKITSVFNFDPCSGDYVHAYLNRPEVQRALHANVTKLHYDWQSCSDIVIDNWNWKDTPSNILPLLQELMANGLRVWIYSGDVDAIVSVTSTQLSIKLMELPIQTPWRPWYLRGEVGGYTTIYKGNLTFATVRGAGHQVPSNKPVRALTLIKSFLTGTKLPTI